MKRPTTPTYTPPFLAFAKTILRRMQPWDVQTFPLDVYEETSLLDVDGASFVVKFPRRNDFVIEMGFQDVRLGIRGKPIDYLLTGRFGTDATGV
jgi:hypothetical protein